MSDSLNKRAASAAKWSIITETLVKVVSPVTQLVLARILAPEAFGMVATVTMVTSFADMFSDSGFQKYLVQHDFDSERSLRKSADVAFWTNMAVSLVLWAGIALLRDPLASLVGSPGLGFPIAVACASLPLTSFSSIQVVPTPARLQDDHARARCGRSCAACGYGAARSGRFRILVPHHRHHSWQCRQRSCPYSSLSVETEFLLLSRAPS